MAIDGRRLFWSVLALVIAIDVVTKVAAERFLFRFAPIAVVGDIVQLRLVYNPGAAFGIHVGPYSRWVFFGLAIVALVVLGAMARTTPNADRFRLVALGLVCGGAAGNLIDRLRSAQGVVDFIDIGIGTLRWPTFNAADTAVSCGAVALAISLWLEGRARQVASTADPSSVSG